jgi:hypothetical protein
MIGDRNKIIAAVAVATLFIAPSAHAQTGGQASLPGWMYTPFPVNGRKADPPKMVPFGGPFPGGSAVNGNRTVIYQSGYPGYFPGYPVYPYGGATVIVNQNPVIYPTNNGYESTPPIVTVVETTPRGRTRMYSGNLFSNCLFPGYTTAFVSGQTVLSPFGTYFGCPPYVYSRYAVSGARYPYLGGRDTSLVISPWSATDPYVTANAERGNALGTALKDLSRFWEQGNAAGLRRRVQPDVPVAIIDNGRLSYSLRRSDFLSIAADALDQIETISFRFTDIRTRTDGLVSAYALHTYRSKDGIPHTTRPHYTFVYLGGDWYLSSVSTLPGG